jgi:hypothetical protein
MVMKFVAATSQVLDNVWILAGLIDKARQFAANSRMEARGRTRGSRGFIYLCRAHSVSAAISLSFTLWVSHNVLCSGAFRFLRRRLDDQVTPVPRLEYLSVLWPDPFGIGLAFDVSAGLSSSVSVSSCSFSLMSPIPGPWAPGS